MFLPIAIRLCKDLLESCTSPSLRFGGGLPIRPQNNEEDSILRLKRLPDH